MFGKGGGRIVSSFHGERASMSSDHRVGTRIIKWVASIRDIGITRDYISNANFL